jgi:hypothetical protein
VIYTYGHIESYDLYIAETSTKYKLGYRKQYNYPNGTVGVYHGGGVWKTPQEAQNYIYSKPPYIENTEDWSVYILDACWETDVYHIPGEPYSRLKEDRIILGKFTGL